MKRPKLTDRSGSSETSVDDQLTEAIIDALSSNDKTIEVRPASGSRSMGATRLLLLVAGTAAFAYWLMSSRRTDDILETAKEETVHRTRRASEEAAESIEAGSEAMSDRIDEGTERASEAVEEAGKKAADRTESAGETVADEAEDSSSSYSGS
jgi:Mg-chelatase subunit ChlI